MPEKEKKSEPKDVSYSSIKYNSEMYARKVKRLTKSHKLFDPSKLLVETLGMAQDLIDKARLPDHMKYGKGAYGAVMGLSVDGDYFAIKLFSKKDKLRIDVIPEFH
ncbi:hypothetical protein ADUPG1_000131, partial [Aduncisulcus paluster]